MDALSVGVIRTFVVIGEWIGKSCIVWGRICYLVEETKKKKKHKTPWEKERPSNMVRYLEMLADDT